MNTAECEKDICETSESQPSGIFFTTIGLALLYWLVSHLCWLAFRNVGVLPMPIWPAAALGFVAGLLFSWKAAPGLFIGAFMANYFSLDAIPLYALLVALGNTVASIAAANLLHRYADAGVKMNWSAENFPILFVTAMLIAPGLSSLVGNSSKILLGIQGYSGILTASAAWWLAHALGILFLAPPLLFFIDRWKNHGKDFASKLSGHIMRVAFFMAAWLWIQASLLNFIWFRTSGNGLLDSFFPTYDSQQLITRLFFCGFLLVGAISIARLMNSLEILERKNMGIAEKLRLSEERFRLAMEATTDGLWDWEIASETGYFSPGYNKMLGYDIGEIPFCAVAWAAMIHPEDKKMALTITNSCIENQCESFELEYRMQTKSGQWKWLLVRGKASDRDENGLAKRLVGTMVDITQRKLYQEELVSERIVTKAFFDSVPGILYLYDFDGELIRWNRQHEKFTGYTTEELYKMQLMDWFKDDEESIIAIKAGIHDTAEKGFGGAEALLQKKDGTKVPMLFTASLLHMDGKKYFAGLGIDLTERKKAELDKIHLQEQLAQSQKLESVGRLAGGIAHDFNNMLGVIVGFSELALQKHDNIPELIRYLEEIRNAALKSADLTRQLLAFARKQSVVPKIIDLNANVSATLNLLKRLLGENINLTWKPSGEPCKIKIDPVQLDQVLTNLCVNAGDAISGTGNVEIASVKIVVDEQMRFDNQDCCPGEFVKITVTDDGCGFDEETKKNIFEPFYTTKGLGKGTGLGLATVYGIVKQNNGFVEVSSKVGMGSSFSLFFPVASGEMDVKASEKAVEPGLCSETTRILIVEDELAILKMTMIVLQKLGYEVVGTESSEEAIEIVAQDPEKFHLLLTDVIMPKMNGKELYDRVRRICPKIRCLFMSGYTANIIARQGIVENEFNFIQKPFKIKEIAEKLQQALHKD